MTNVKKDSYLGPKALEGLGRAAIIALLTFCLKVLAYPRESTRINFDLPFLAEKVQEKGRHIRKLTI